MNDKTKRIAALNDELRATLGLPVFGKPKGRILATRGIQALPPEDQIIIMAAIRDFRDFKKDDDPYGEHDFGAVSHNGRKIFWKIDYYGPDMMSGSADPSDPEKTVRVLTIMLAQEY